MCRFSAKYRGTNCCFFFFCNVVHQQVQCWSVEQTNSHYYCFSRWAVSIRALATPLNMKNFFLKCTVAKPICAQLISNFLVSSNCAYHWVLKKGTFFMFLNQLLQCVCGGIAPWGLLYLFFYTVRTNAHISSLEHKVLK